MTPLRYVSNFRPQHLGPPLDQILDPHLHPVGTLINFAFCEEIRKFCLAFTMVVYEKIFGSINK